MIGLCLARGIILGNGFPLKDLWNQRWGLRIFSQVVRRDRFLSLIRFLRFDDKRTRQSRLRNDKFALVSDNMKSLFRIVKNISILMNF